MRKASITRRSPRTLSDAAMPPPGPMRLRTPPGCSNLLFGADTMVQNVRVRIFLVRRELVIEEDQELEDCINTGSAQIRRGGRPNSAIVDRDDKAKHNGRIGQQGVYRRRDTSWSAAAAS